MLEEVPRCPLCRSGRHHRCRSLNVAFEGGIYNSHLWQCRACGHRWFSPRVTAVGIARAYAADYLWQAPDAEGGLMAAAAEAYRRQLLTYEVQKDIRLTRLKSGSRILDYGTGYGDRLEHFSTRGMRVAGYEPFFRPEHRVRTEIYARWEQVQAAVDRNSPDMVQFNHVLGHIHDPGQPQSLFKRLKPGAWVVVRTPNPDSVQARLCGSRWQALDPPRMLHLFSVAGLGAWLSDLGFVCRRVDYDFHLLHPPTLVLSLFPFLDPLKSGGQLPTLRILAWGGATLLAVPVVAIEGLMGCTAIYTAYFQKTG